MKFFQTITFAHKRSILILPLLAISLLSLSCSAKEATATAGEVAAPTENTQTKTAQPGTQKASVDVRYTALFEKAKQDVVAGLAANPGNFVDGQHYDKFPARQAIIGSADKIEVAEFFSYGCGGCFNSEPYMHAYAGQVADDVNFIRVPVSFNPFFELLARGYYAAQALGVDSDAHIALFDAIHIKGKDLSKEKALADFYAQYGVDKEKFLKSLHSFSVNSMIERDKKLAQSYDVRGVPTVIVNGAYNTGGSKAGTYNAWFQILDTLTEKERASLKLKTTAAQ